MKTPYKKTNDVTSQPWYRKFDRFVQLKGLAERSQDVYLNWMRQIDRHYPKKTVPGLSSDDIKPKDIDGKRL